MTSTLSSLRSLIKHRHKLFKGIRHDVAQQYTGSVLGMLWVVLFPLLQLSVYAALYTMIFKVRPAGLTEVSYTLLVFSGLVPLMAFSQSLVTASSSLIANKNLLLNTVFPSELIPVRAAIAAHMPTLIGLIITLVLGVVLERTNWLAVIFIPILWISLMMFAIGLGWILSLLSLIAKDIQQAIGLILMLVIVLSPFAYTPDMVPRSLKFIIYFNPLSYFVLSFQQIIVYGVPPDPLISTVALGLGLGSFFLGFIVFQKAKSIFFDYA